jgi:biotin carboxyl carrier protein
MQFKAIVDGKLVHGTIRKLTDGALAVTVEDRAYSLDARLVEPGVYWLKWNDRSFEATAVGGTPNAYTVSIGGCRFKVEMEDNRRALRKAGREGNAGVVEIRAPMPGKIVRVLAAQGTTVESNQGVVVMEAMKMQNEIRSPKAGTVTKLAVSEGMAVNLGDLLATVE